MSLVCVCVSVCLVSVNVSTHALTIRILADFYKRKDACMIIVDHHQQYI
jgi:hypothetical protein